MKRLLSIIIMLSMVVCLLPVQSLAQTSITATCNIADGATDVSNPTLTEQVTITFNQPMHTSTLNSNYVVLCENNWVKTAQYSVSADNTSISFDIRNLRPYKTYTVTIKEGIKNADEVALSEDISLLTFTTDVINVSELGQNEKLTNVSDSKTVTTEGSKNPSIITDGKQSSRFDGSDADQAKAAHFTIDLEEACNVKAADMVLHGGYGGFNYWKVYGHNDPNATVSEMTELAQTPHEWISHASNLATYRIFFDNDTEYRYITFVRESNSFWIYECTLWAHISTGEPETPDIGGGTTPSPNKKMTFSIADASEIYSKNGKDKTINPGERKFVYMSSTEYAVWDVEIPEEGKYLISFFAGFSSSSTNADVKTYVDINDGLGFVPMAEQSVIKGKNMNDLKENPACVMSLEAGTIRVKLLETFYELYLSDLVISRYDDFVLNSVKAGEEKIIDGDTIERSTDCFELTFNRNLNSASASKVKLVNNETGVALKSEAETENNILTLYLNETLDYDAEYSLVLGGISDVYDVYQLDDTYASYTTASADDDIFVSLGISDDKNSIDYNKIEITGTVLSSQGKLIGGRTVDAYLKDTKGTVSTEPVATCVSGEGGVFKLNYTIPEESDSGLYTFILEAEYADSKTEVSTLYVSKTINEKITGALKTTKDFNEVYEVIDTYKLILDVNPSEDLKGISDTDRFYNHFVGKAYDNFNEFRTDYHNMIVFERVNQTSDTKVVENILKDEEACVKLSADKHKTDRVITDRENFLKELADLKVYDEHSDYMIEFNRLLNEYLSREFGKEKPVISTESVSVYTGQGIPLKLAFAENVTEVSGFEFRVTSLDGTELLTNPSVVLDIKGEYTTMLQDDTLVITVTAGMIITKVKDIATLYLASPESAGTYDFVVSAFATHRVSDKAEDGSKIWYEADNKADDKNITATVTASSQGSHGSGSSVTPSGGKKPSSSGSVGGFTPVVTPAPQDTKYIFADLPAGHWAEESINALVEKGVISKPENRIYNPDKLISREEFIKLIVVAFDMWNKDIQGDAFSDVTIDNWYYSYVYSAEQCGIITGDGNGAFGSGSAITREDMAVIIKRVMELKNIAIADGTNDTFSDDGEIAEYAKPAVYAMKNAGIINGVGGNAFEPKTGATRAMAAKVIYYLTKIIAN